MDESTSLDPDFLEESSQTGIEDYICCICQLIPNPETALEEENCGHLFCNTCIANWSKKSKACPFCKMTISTRIIKEKNKMIYRHLINLMVICQEENCKWKGIYKDYIEHLKNSHNKIMEINNNINNIIITSSGKYELYKYYKATTHNHPLKFLDTTMDNGWRCNSCQIISGLRNNNNSHKNIKRYRCVQCDYDLCENCMNKYYDSNYIIKNDNSNNRSLYLFKKKYYSQAHEHPLVFLDKSEDNGWACNGKNLINKCFSGITDFNQTQNIPRFRCEKCDFDLCENCMNYYRKKKFYEINKTYKVTCHSHPLTFLGISNDDDGWVCDGKNLPEKCLSGITNFDQTKGFERFRCEKCDFDLCRNCMDFYLKDKKGYFIF